MITVEEAKNLLMQNIGPLDPAEIKIEEAVGRVLAGDIFSPLDLPPYNQSAMDGYAVKIFPGKNPSFFRPAGEIKAGDRGNIDISYGEAVRIFTGAPVPSSADCVVVQEKITIKNKTLYIGNNLMKKNENIRFKGSQIKQGELALAKGTELNPAAIGFLASLGIKKIPVYRSPEVVIIITGNELKSAGTGLKEGQIFESNSYSLAAGLRQMNIFPKKVWRVRDEKKTLVKKIREGISMADIVIVSGGISVGKYDLVRESLEENGVNELFYKVAQKPGKPLFAGKSGKKTVFALPGNPAATMICFYEYVYPAIKKLMGAKRCFLPVRTCKILNNVIKSSDRAYFLKAKLSGDGVYSLEGQDSYMMKSFLSADALIYLPSAGSVSPIKRSSLRKGKKVEVHLL